MIAYLCGKIILSQNNFVVVENSGIGYRLVINPVLVMRKGEEAAFFIHHHFRENSQELYGFKTFSELELFEKLISVNGVGPKAAMSIVSASDVARITDAIIHDDITFFTALPGVGKKAAAKIILDLKKKITGMEADNLIGRIDEANDVIDSLVALGYKKFEVAKVLIKMPNDIVSTEGKIKWCLKNLAK